MENQGLELKVDAGDRACHLDGDLNDDHAVDCRENCDITVEVFTSVGECGVEKGGCEVPTDVNGSCVVVAEVGDVVDEVHSPEEKDGELTVDVNGGCVEKMEVDDGVDEVHGHDAVSDAAEKDCMLTIDVNGNCDVVVKEKGGLNSDAHCHDADLCEEKEDCEVVKEVVTLDANNAAVNGGCLVGKEKGGFSTEAVTTKVAGQELGQKEEDIERRIGHYTNRQKILLVGEGDFSFAACLAKAFRRATNITATSLGDRASVIRKYYNGEMNLQSLEDYGATVIHEVDAHTMNKHLELEPNLYDRIVFNFPHHGDICGGEQKARVIENHQKLVAGFFVAAKYMVGRSGEIHVTHKTANPFDRWNIEELAEDAGLVLRRKAEFSRWDYPDYENKKAYGLWPDSTFPVGWCSTFMFSTA